MIYIFLIIGIAIVYIDYWINRRIISVISVLTIPYLVIVPLNNWYAVKFGFYSIENKTILMLMLALVCFFIGNMFANMKRRVSKTKVIIDYEQNHTKFELYKMKNMLVYVYAVEFTGICRLLSIIADEGVHYLSTSDFEGLLIQGIWGHLLLTAYPLVPILFYYYTESKKQSYLIASLLYIGLLFFTFVKYHSIGAIVLIFLFVAFENRKYIKRGAVLVTLVTIVAFISNYFITFLIRGTTAKVQRSYYFRHLWNYIAGSLIHDNTIWSTGVGENQDTLYRLVSVVLTPVNVVLSKIAGIRLVPPVSIPYVWVGNNGEKGNVLDAIGYLFPGRMTIGNIFLFGIILVFVGWLFGAIYNHAIRVKGHFAVGICAFLTFFCFFSFFGTFYIHLPPWEIIFWCFLMPRVFDKRVKIIV